MLALTLLTLVKASPPLADDAPRAALLPRSRPAASAAPFPAGSAARLAEPRTDLVLLPLELLAPGTGRALLTAAAAKLVLRIGMGLAAGYLSRHASWLGRFASLVLGVLSPARASLFGFDPGRSG